MFSVFIVSAFISTLKTRKIIYHAFLPPFKMTFAWLYSTQYSYSSCFSNSVVNPQCVQKYFYLVLNLFSFHQGC